jgi:hypothetical protein
MPLAAPIAYAIAGLELSVNVKWPLAMVGGTTGTASVIVWRLAIPAPMSPWNAPVVLTTENEVTAVGGVLGTGAAFASWIVIDPVCVAKVKVSVEEIWPVGLTSFTMEPVTVTWPRPVIVPEP